MGHRRHCPFPVLIGFFALVTVPAPVAADETSYTRQQLIEDAYQLRDTIEATHPDPYLNGGGKIAFHRRFQEVLAQIPDDGLSREEFIGLLQPFVAVIGDSHTAVINAAGEGTPIHLPVGFKIVEDGLVVDRVALREQASLLGGRMMAMEGVSMADLITRQGRLRGFENRYGKLAIMTLRTLNTLEGLARLVPEWTGDTMVRLDLRLPDGTEVELELELLDAPPDAWITPSTSVSMPSLAASDVAYSFVDPERSAALLVISGLMRYREACEMWFDDGYEEAETLTRAAHSHFHGTPGPDDIAELLAGIPSATSTVAALVDEMRTAGTKNLIVDLRGNTGGNSAMREILVYLLFGDRAMRSVDNGFQITRISPLLFEQYSSLSLEKINEGQPVSLRVSDYDFSEERSYRDTRSQATQNDVSTLAKAPSFWKVYESGAFHEPTWLPENLLVLSDPLTFSSGFNVLTGLYSLGAVVVGTPSAQPGNNFGDMLVFPLQHTGVRAAVSHKQVVTFPDDPELGRCLRPSHTLTFEKYAAHDFDPNSEVLLALDVLRVGAGSAVP